MVDKNGKVLNPTPHDRKLYPEDFPNGLEWAYKWVPEIGDEILYSPLSSPVGYWEVGVVEEYDPVFWGSLKINGEWVGLSNWKWETA